MKSFKDFRTSLSEEQLDEALITFGGVAYPKFGQVLIMAGGAGCFSGDTLVITENGPMPIKDIKRGIKVKTFNEDTKEYEFKEVTEEFSYPNIGKDIVEVKFENGETMICTEDHEFYVDGEWVQAKDLI